MIIKTDPNEFDEKLKNLQENDVLLGVRSIDLDQDLKNSCNLPAEEMVQAFIENNGEVTQMKARLLALEQRARVLFYTKYLASNTDFDKQLGKEVQTRIDMELKQIIEEVGLAIRSFLLDEDNFNNFMTDIHRRLADKMTKAC